MGKGKAGGVGYVASATDEKKSPGKQLLYFVSAEPISSLMA
jgi:hypothetical protein